MDVGHMIGAANIARDFEPVTGECISIANAIHSVFGGTLVAISRQPDTRVIDHAAVRIDGTLYDGRGAVTEDQLCREFAMSDNPQPDAHVWEPMTTDTRPFRGDVYQEVKDRLEEAVDDETTFGPPGGDT